MFLSSGLQLRGGIRSENPRKNLALPSTFSYTLFQYGLDVESAWCMNLGAQQFTCMAVNAYLCYMLRCFS